MLGATSCLVVVVVVVVLVPDDEEIFSVTLESNVANSDPKQQMFL